MAERQIQPSGAIRLLQEIFLVHTESSAQQLHGNHWKAWYNPENVLEPDTILQDTQKSQLLTDTAERVLKTISPLYADRLSVRLGLYDNRVHTLEETGREFGVSGEQIRFTASRAIRQLRHPTSSRLFKQFLPARTQRCLNHSSQ